MCVCVYIYIHTHLLQRKALGCSSANDEECVRGSNTVVFGVKFYFGQEIGQHE